MDRRAFSPFLTCALFLTLVGSIFSTLIPMQTSSATHTDIEDVEIEGGETEYGQGDTVTIRGTVDGGDDTDQVDFNVDGPDGTDDFDEDLDDDGDFVFNYDISNSAEDGLYQVSIEFGSEEPVYVYFIVNENHDSIVDTDSDTYDLDEDVSIDGTIDEDVLSSVDEVEITILDPNGNEVVDSDAADVDTGDGDFDYNDFTTDDGDDAHGFYAVVVSYDDEEEAWHVFEVVEGGSDEDPVTITLTKTSYKQGEEVVISGEVADPDPSVEAFVTVEDSDGNEVFDDHEDPTNSGAYEFEFTLEDDAEIGTYTITVEYNGDEAEKEFTVTTSTSGGSGGSGSGSGSDSGLTGRLSKTSLLAGETVTVTGVVPKIIADQPVNIVVLKPDGRSAGVYYYPEPSSDKSYTATLRLPSTLEEDEDYTVVVGYDNKEVRLNFDITGKTTGSGGAVSVQVDRTAYTVGSTVKITGEIADDIFVPGLLIALQVYNPDKALYRTDPIEPEGDGTFSYSMPVGGPLGVSGKWVVKVTYNSQIAETGFDLSGGVPSKPRFDLKFEDQTFPIEYESAGAVRSMYVRPTEKTLVVAIDGEEEGTLTIKLPREVIDAVQSGSDIKFIVSILDTDTGDEKLVEVSESTTSSDARTLVIDYDQGTDLIEIQGTTIVPEFGHIAAIVLAIAVFGLIAATSRFSGRFSTFRVS